MADTWNLAPADAATTQSFTSTSSSQSLIEPQANVLDKFASYTYQASVYLMSPDQYRNLLSSVDKNIPDSQLLFQSGGKTVGNKFFDNDFYIDNITLDTVLAGKQTQSAHMATDLKFTVTEPMGITLLDRLYNAVADAVPTDAGGNANFSAAQFLMAIRFFGYDQTGKLSAPGIPAMAGNTTNPKAVVVKYIPFLIKKINWTVGTKLVSYEIEAAPIGQITGGSTNRGTVPFDIELVAKSVGEILSGTATFYTQAGTTTAGTTGTGGGGANAPANAGAAPTTINKVITSGLMDALNQYQQDLVKKRNIYTIADEYEIEFVDSDEIKQAQLILPTDQIDKKTVAMAAGADVTPQSLDSNKIPVNNTQRIMPITAGQSVTQVIELIIRNSSYITGQAAVTNNPDGSPDPAEKPPQKPMKWFLITYSATPIGNKIDPKRNDFAYKIKYTVTKYSVPNFESKYFPITAFPGLHKQYNYWFTGQNTSVLEYTANYDSLYNITVSGTKAGDSLQDQRKKLLTSSARDLPKYTYNPRSSQGVGYGDNKSNESSANAAEYLYNPDSLSTSRMRIIGDPAWIQQGSLFKPISVEDFKAEAKLGFLPDGTISFDSSQVLYEIAWQRPEDYDLKSGLADPYAKTFKKYGERLPLQSNIYQAMKVVSEFRNGQFEQTLEGSLYFYNKPPNSTTAAGPAAANPMSQDPQQRAESQQAANAATSAASPTRTGGAANGGISQFTSAAQGTTGTTLAPIADLVNQTGIRDPSQLSQAAQQVPNIVASLPALPVTSNGQLVGLANGNGLSFLNSTPQVLTPGAGRTTLDALQSAALSIPPYQTRRDT